MIRPRLTGRINPHLAKAILMQTHADELFLWYDFTVGEHDMGLALPCSSLCEQARRRPHLRCLNCSGKQAYYGRESQPIPVTAHIIYQPVGLSRWRQVLAKLVRSVHSVVTGV